MSIKSIKEHFRKYQINYAAGTLAGLATATLLVLVGQAVLLSRIEHKTRDLANEMKRVNEEYAGQVEQESSTTRSNQYKIIQAPYSNQVEQLDSIRPKDFRETNSPSELEEKAQ